MVVDCGVTRDTGVATFLRPRALRSLTLLVGLAILVVKAKRRQWDRMQRCARRRPGPESPTPVRRRARSSARKPLLQYSRARTDRLGDGSTGVVWRSPR